MGSTGAGLSQTDGLPTNRISMPDLGAKRARFFLDQKEIHHSRELGWISSNK
jgi:hypothetical protein